MYICMITFNDRDDVNSELFQKLKLRVNWFMVLIIISAVFTSYCLLLLLFALIQVALGEQLDLHWLHKIFLFFGVIFVVAGVTTVIFEWKGEWPTVPLSLQATAPFLQFGAVGALMLLSPFVFQSIKNAKTGSKFLIGGVFLILSAAIFLWPLFIRSPCLKEPQELPKKPKLIGHRGAPMLAPENTIMAFNSSITCNVTAFETDVQVSKDRIPFLMHDHGADFLLRTTDVKEKFSGQHFNDSTNLTFEEVHRLNAGDWFLKTDPFDSVSMLSEEEKERARSQTVPSLLQLLSLAREHTIKVIFDLKSSTKENKKQDTVDIVNTILNSSIDQSLIFWLPDQKEYVSKSAPGFIHVYKNEEDMRKYNGSCLNMKYNELEMEKIRNLREENVTVNLYVVNERWLFSLLWCAGVSSVTTNSCHLLKDVDYPDWVMAPSTYLLIWVLVDIVALFIMIGLFLFWKKYGCCDEDVRRNNTPACNEKELQPLSPKVP
ncbi:glycerophosphoinositol inositolphosphodiesterase GDPD2 isoform 2-T2 [Pholidichthys leucotaenia]